MQCRGVASLRIEFSGGDENAGDCSEDGTVRPATITATARGQTVRLTVGDTDHELSREAAAALREAVGEALTERHEFLRTVGEHRDDGSYVVSRRGADSTGNSTVFECFDELDRLYDRLPVEFTAEDLSRSGITGSRRHMLVWHFAEHPAFDCSLASRNPLTVEKTG